MFEDPCTVLEGDCLDLLPTLPSASVDAVVTDPPFGIGFSYEGRKEQTNNAVDYWNWFQPIYNEMLRCLKPGGFCAIWQSQLHFRYFWDWFGPEIHIYCAAKNFVQLRATPINYGYDPVVMFYKAGADPLRPCKPKRNIDFFVANTAGIISNPMRIERGHPCPRPMDLMTNIIENFTLTEALVLDSFAGSGSTALACQNTGRRFIGIEREPSYCKIARERLAASKTLWSSAA